MELWINSAKEIPTMGPACTQKKMLDSMDCLGAIMVAQIPKRVLNLQLELLSDFLRSKISGNFAKSCLSGAFLSPKQEFRLAEISHLLR